MKKILYFLLALGIFCSHEASSFDYSAEIKAAYFIPTDKTFRRIYGGSGVYTLELSTPLCYSFEGWTSVGYFAQSGRSIGEKDRTRIAIIPVGLGLKYHYSFFDCLDGYLGLGFQANYVKMHDRSKHAIHHIYHWGMGCVAKAGLLYDLGNCFYVDLFTDYSYCQISFHRTHREKVVRHRTDLSNVTIGLGFIFKF